MTNVAPPLNDLAIWRVRSNCTRVVVGSGLELTSVAAGNADVDNHLSRTVVVPGTTYSMSINLTLTAPASRGGQLAVEWVKSDGSGSTVTAASTATATLTPGVQKSLLLSAPAPSDAATARIILRVQNTAAGGEKLLMNDLVMDDGAKSATGPHVRVAGVYAQSADPLVRVGGVYV